MPVLAILALLRLFGLALGATLGATTTDMVVALRYAISPESLLFKVVTSSFMERGVNLEYLSCFPGEAEHLFPPLTYLRPTGNSQVIECGIGGNVTVVEVTPIFGT